MLFIEIDGINPALLLHRVDLLKTMGHQVISIHSCESILTMIKSDEPRNLIYMGV